MIANRPMENEVVNVKNWGATGSESQIEATTTADSKKIVVKDTADFRQGQQITVDRCNTEIISPMILGPESPYGSRKPLGDAAQIRGYKPEAGSWIVFILEIDSASPHTFRWSDNLLRGNKWNEEKVAVTWDWQKLSKGIEIKFNDRNLCQGHIVTFSGRDRLTTVIEKIEENVLTVRDAPNLTSDNAVVKHEDSPAIQKAVDYAVANGKNVFFPAGHYRLSESIKVDSAKAVSLEGVNGVDALMDISDGSGAVFRVCDCQEITIRNFRMIGHTPMTERAGSFRLSHGRAWFWTCALKPCNAVTLSGTERALIENVHASRMASECFYASGSARRSDFEQDKYQKALTYLRCSVTDCASNAFNNNDMGENTSVLYCRVVDSGPSGWHSAEMPARFLKLIGNYVRNSGPFTVGDMSHRYDDLNNLGCGQAIVSNNVFEGGDPFGGIVVTHGSSQVVISNNLFINYNGTAIRVSSQTHNVSFPANTVTITGNVIDMTCIGDDPRPRSGIKISLSNVIAADNQIYVRGGMDPLTTGIEVSEPAVNVTLHDNLIRNCMHGLLTGRLLSNVSEVTGQSEFLQTDIPLEWRDSHLYRGWSLVWTTGDNKGKLSTIDAYDPDTQKFTLRGNINIRAGESFNAFPAVEANWNIHNNTITGCQNPVDLNSYGSESSVFKGNVITRGDISGVKAALIVRGRFKLTNNHVSGFDEENSAALLLETNSPGCMEQNLYMNNIFENCYEVAVGDLEKLWEKRNSFGNICLKCKRIPDAGCSAIE